MAAFEETGGVVVVWLLVGGEGGDPLEGFEHPIHNNTPQPTSQGFLSGALFPSVSLSFPNPETEGRERPWPWVGLGFWPWGWSSVGVGINSLTLGERQKSWLPRGFPQGGSMHIRTSG